MEDGDIFGFELAEATTLKNIARISSGNRDGKSDSFDAQYDATRLALAYTTSSGSARSGATLGSGTADLKRIDASNDVVAFSPVQSVTFYNLAASVVASGVYIMLLRWGNKWVVVWEECT